MKHTKDYLLFRPRQAFMISCFFLAPVVVFGPGEAVLHGCVADETARPIAFAFARIEETGAGHIIY